ncbi:MAG TPA: hypothetical protein PLF78_09225 [Caulobacter sp.]|nr:hypothetical protein [Caulobacter sp.]
MGKPWFNPKTYGYGAGLPCSWEGWAVLAAFLAVVVGGRSLLPSDGAYALLVLGAVVVLIVVAALKTRGGWRWRWGQD